MNNFKDAQGNIVTIITKANKDTVSTVQTAAGDTIKTIQKAGGDTISTIRKAADDSTATYIKGWRDTARQSERSFKDIVEAGHAVERYEQRQLEHTRATLNHAQQRVREGKVIDAMWGLAVEPAQGTESNFAKATQESSLINSAAQAAAATYGGPAGAAAYAAWYTYRATGDANLAIRTGILSGLSSEAGGSIGNMPSGTASELLKKSIMTGAVAGVAVAAAGGDDQSIKDAFFKSGSAVLIQGGNHRLTAYSPKAAEAISAVQCVSARDVDCLSNTTYARDLKGKVLYDENGKPRIDPRTIDAAQEVGRWADIDQNASDVKAKMTSEISKLPDTEAIPILHNQWVLSWTFAPHAALQHNKPSVVLTYVGHHPPFFERAFYRSTKKSPGALRHMSSVAGSSSAPREASYICRAGASVRSVTTYVSAEAQSCNAIYAKGNLQTVVWQSAHKPNSCAAHVSAFIRDLHAKHIECSIR